MSVLIKEMTMPDSCLICDLESDAFYYDAICSQTLKCVTDYVDSRPDFCPLIPIPDHGDLIDRDALNATDSWEWIRHGAPVVIPAERNEEKCTKD